MTLRLTRRQYADLYGPTTGDRVRLADTELFIRIERDLTVPGDEAKFGGGKVIRDGMGQSARATRADGVLDCVITNAVIIDHWGIVKADIGLRDGRIAGIGKAGNPDVMAGVSPGMIVGASTEVTDLHGSFLMPGLIDGHMHPLGGGLVLRKCGLNYEPLTVPEMQGRIQDCLDKTKNQEPDGWLQVVSWFQESMRPPGVKTSRATLDALKTSRPIIVRSSFGHTALANSRALGLAKITKATPDPLGGRVARRARGAPHLS